MRGFIRVFVVGFVACREAAAQDMQCFRGSEIPNWKVSLRKGEVGRSGVILRRPMKGLCVVFCCMSQI